MRESRSIDCIHSNDTPYGVACCDMWLHEVVYARATASRPGEWEAYAVTCSPAKPSFELSLAGVAGGGQGSIYRGEPTLFHQVLFGRAELRQHPMPQRSRHILYLIRLPASDSCMAAGRLGKSCLTLPRLRAQLNALAAASGSRSHGNASPSRW